MANKYKKRRKVLVHECWMDHPDDYGEDAYYADDVTVIPGEKGWPDYVQPKKGAKPLTSMYYETMYYDYDGYPVKEPVIEGNPNYLKYGSKYGPMKSKKPLTSLKERQRAVFNKALSEGKSRKEAWQLCQRVGRRKGQW